MAYKSTAPEAISRYVNEVLVKETPVQKKLREETQKLPDSNMQISPDQAALLSMLARLTRTRRAIEVGTFTGYSALAVALVLPPDGQLICCDVSEPWTTIARRYWKEAGLDHLITLHLAPALQTLNGLIAKGEAGTFDFAFIDADKTGYDSYYEATLQLLRPGGLIILDNVLRHGEVPDPDVHNPSTDAIRALNLKIASDPRVHATLLTVGDGFMLAHKR